MLKNIFCLFGVFLFCSVARQAVAQVPLGHVVANLPYRGLMVADPVRPRLYMLQTADNSVISIDTTTLTVVGVLPTGAGPHGLAITPRSDLLYVSTSTPGEAIDLIGLDDFLEYNSFAFPDGLSDIATGVGNRLFVLPSSSLFDFYQLDGFTGETQAKFSLYGLSETYYGGLKATPDGKTLLASSLGVSRTVGSVERYDISKRKTVKKGSSGFGGILAFSHDGKMVANGVLPNFINPISAYTDLYSVTAPGVLKSAGSYRLPSPPGPMAFSADDQVIYQTLASGDFYAPTLVTYQGNVVYLYDPNTRALLDTLPLPTVADGSTDTISRSVAVDRTGSYLFVGQHGTAPDGTVIDRTLVIGTGRGSGLPKPRSVVGVAANQATVTAGSGKSASFLLTRAGDLSQPLTVAYTLGGSAENGTDYRTLSGRVTILAGNVSALVHVSPVADTGPDAKTVTLTVRSGTVVDAHQNPEATVTIQPHP